ncbi:PAS domain-containing protein [Flavisolibacter sp. BT320]|nr:PAS domain-containing protein [Flavisolibacter longurius]
MNAVTRHPSAIDLQLFRAMPGNSVLLLPDAPHYTIVAATDAYLQITGRRLEDIIGRGLFAVFPNNPVDPGQSSHKEVLSLLEHVLHLKQPHARPFRYDIEGTNGVFTERHWMTRNTPVLDENGEISYIILTVEDITSGVLANSREERMKGLEKSYRDLMQAPMLLCIVKGPDYRIALANEQMLRFWDRNEGVIGQPFLQVLPELKTQGFPDILEKVQRTGNAEQLYQQPTVLVRNGVPETLYLDLVFQPYFEEGDRQPSGVICVAHDQTVQVLNRQRAEETEHRFRDLIAEATVPTALYFGREIRIRYANEAMLRLWGKDSSVIGKTVREALPELDGQPFYGQLDHVFATGETYWGKEDKGELVVDGKLQTFYFNFTYKALRNSDGEIYGILNMATDVTELVTAKKKLQESESNLRATILQAPVAMCILRGPDHIVDIANDRIFELWGKSREEMQGRPLFEALPEVGNQGYEEMLHQVYTTGKRVEAEEAPVTLPRKGGIQLVYVNFVYEQFREGDGTVSGVIVVATEVTGQVETRKNVEASEQRVRSLVESAPFPIGVYNGREMRIELANQAIIKVWGKGPDVVGKRYAEVLPELAGSGIYAQLDEVFTTGVPFHARNQRVDLEVAGQLNPYFFNYSFTPLYDASGAIYGVMNTAADITDLVLARQKVEQSEQRFQNLVREAPVGIVVLAGENLTISVVNDAYARLIGREAGDLLQKEIFSIIPETETSFRQFITQTKESGEPIYLYDQPYQVFAGDRTIEGYLNVVYQPYRETDGAITGVMVLCQDVTLQVQARKKIEEAQETARLAVDSAGLGTYAVDLRTDTLTSSMRLDDIFDVSHASERSRYVCAIHPDDLPLRKEAYEKAYRSGQLEYEARVVRKNGEIRWIRARGKVFFEDGKPVNLVGVVQDITEEKSFAEELSRKVQERTQELEQFLFVSHHDLQEPLRKIIMFSDMLKTENLHLLPEASQKRFDKIMDAARRMSAALRDVLDFASLSKDQLFTSVDLNTVVDSVLSDLELVIAEKGATVQSADLPVIPAIPQQMHQLFYNLLSNALKFTVPGQTPLILISQQRLDGDGIRQHADLEGGRQYVQLTVRDNGIGFRQELAEKIFTLFQRLHSKEQYAGTGIGLALCRKVVQNHRGKIWAESGEGEGAAFHFILPV